MSEREAALRKIVFEVRDQTGHGILDALTSQQIGELAFSGYGEFTPITVSAETVLEDANVERDKHRNHTP